MNLIVEIRFGSHLYGTDTPQSDLDVKGVYIPDARDILLQLVKPLIADQREKAVGEKNTAVDVDREAYSLQRYLELLCEGQTVALDMLFAPDCAMITPPTAVWNEVRTLAPKLITKRSAAFVRYCQQQASKYGIRGSRIAAARHVLDLLRQAKTASGAAAKLEVAREALFAMEPVEHVALYDVEQASGKAITTLEVCGRKILFTTSLETATGIVQRVLDEYGKRAFLAERNEGVDWKALSHALRVGYEAVELLSTGRITFPRPEAEHLKAVKLGQLPYREIGAEIETQLAMVVAAEQASKLPETPDYMAVDDLVARVYGEAVRFVS